MVNQMVAKSLQRFVDGLPEPEPNSARAARGVRIALEVGGGRAATPTRSDKASPEPDVLAAALGRLRDAREQSQADRNAPEGSEDRPAAAERVRQPVVSDRLRLLMDEADKQSATEPSDTTAETVRQVRARDRAYRDRDRSPDKGGPGR